MDYSSNDAGLSTLEQLLCAGQGFEQIEIVRDDGLGMIACIAIHSTKLGPAFGGIRRFEYPNLAAAVEDALALARAMTAKCALVGVPGGGAKTVLWQRPGLDRERAYERLGEHIEALAGRYYTGPDVGTTVDDLRRVGTRTRFVALPDGGQAGDLAEPTALGVYAGIRAVVDHLDPGRSLGPGVHVAVQGLGAVGSRLACLLAADGCRLSLSDVREELAARLAQRLGGTVVPASEILAVACDVFAPCAMGGVLDVAGVARLGARAVAGSANNVLSDPAVGHALHERGIRVVPDALISSGALLHGATFHLEGQVPAPDRVLAIGARTADVLAEAAERGVSPQTVVEDRVATILGAAPSRRWFGSVPPDGSN